MRKKHREKSPIGAWVALLAPLVGSGSALALCPAGKRNSKRGERGGRGGPRQRGVARPRGGGAFASRGGGAIKEGREIQIWADATALAALPHPRLGAPPHRPHRRHLPPPRPPRHRPLPCRYPAPPSAPLGSVARAEN